MRELSLRVLLVVAAVALLAACLTSFALVATQSDTAAPSGELHVYGDR
jgi:hypothetical protein